MEESLLVLHEAECAYKVRVRLEHIRSDKNVVADHLSHDQYAKVEALFDKRGLQLQRMGEDRKILNGAKTWVEFIMEAEKRVTHALGRADQETWESSDEDE